MPSASAAGAEEADQLRLLRQGAALLQEWTAEPEAGPVVKLASPEELYAAFRDAGVPLPLEDGHGPATADELTAALAEVLRYSVRTHHQRFYNQLYARHEPAGVLGEWTVAAANTNVHTYEVAPVFTLVEVELLAKLARVVGFRSGHDGLFVPGGSISNLYAIHLARLRRDPDAKRRGAAGGPRLVAFTSAHSHYSFAKAAAVLGLGTDNMIEVATDDHGRLLPAALDEAVQAALQRGQVPFFVGLTAGTTVTGAFDPIQPVLGIAARHGMWVHLDAAYGGAALLSAKHRALLDGVEGADSVSWNLHKMMGVPVQCSAFLTRHPGILASCNGVAADYLFQPDKLNAEWDLGDKTIQCGRRADAFKAWMQWKAVGDAGWAARVERSAELAAHLEAAVEASDAFQLAIPRSFTNVCFFWVPPALRPLRLADMSAAERAALGALAPAIKARLQADGFALVGYQPLDSLPNFFRMVLTGTNLATTPAHMDELLRRIDALGHAVIKAQM